MNKPLIAFFFVLTTVIGGTLTYMDKCIYVGYYSHLYFIGITIILLGTMLVGIVLGIAITQLAKQPNKIDLAIIFSFVAVSIIICLIVIVLKPGPIIPGWMKVMSLMCGGLWTASFFLLPPRVPFLEEKIAMIRKTTSIKGNL